MDLQTNQKYKVIDIDNFDNLDLKEDLLRGIYAYGYEKPSAIQRKGIHPIINGHDLIAQAQSGTGKTATFSIGALQLIDEKLHETQAIILAHTRELAIQIQSVVKHLSAYIDINVSLSVGGTNLRENINELNENPHIVIGTPGRILDMIRRMKCYLKFF